MGITPLTTLEIFRLVAREYEEIKDAEVGQWIELCMPFVSRRKFGNLYAQALALLTAHRMKLAGVNISDGDDPLDELKDIGVSNLMRVGSYSEGQTSISFNTNQTQYAALNAELSLTPYGIQYLSLRRMRIMSITSAGES